MDDDKDFKKIIKERFGQLPKVVQDAITSADVEKRLRDLANTHKLHLDQWETLENQVMLTLLGIEHSDDLEKNIKSGVGVDEETAKSLTADISKIVFEPIREELERQLEHPDAKAAEVSGVEAARTQVLGGEMKPAAPAVLPATPPQPQPTERAVRAPISEAYKAGEPSTARKAIEDDPYREPPA
jgi:hypothetical protein